MRNIDPEYIGVAEAARVVETCLQKARARHGAQISMCGGETNWDDCLTAYVGANHLVYMLWYNLGANTFIAKQTFGVDDLAEMEAI